MFKQPLADLMRPQSLEQMVGQRQLLAPGKPLRQIIDRAVPMSLILWGPPGCGKSSLAKVMAKSLGLQCLNSKQDPAAGADQAAPG